MMPACSRKGDDAGMLRCANSDAGMYGVDNSDAGMPALRIEECRHARR